MFFFELETCQKFTFDHELAYNTNKNGVKQSYIEHHRYRNKLLLKLFSYFQ